MGNCTHIEVLIGKLMNGNLLPGELQELQEHFRSLDVTGDVDAWLTGLWEASGHPDGVSVDSKRILSQLNERIHQKNRKQLPSKVKSDKIQMVIRSFMRYAAVFLLAMGVSWYYYRQDKPAVTDKIADLKPANGNNEISVTYGSKTRIMLPDSSVVYLNSGSKLHYPSVFTGERHVSLTGEGYFIVRSDSLHPFLVHTTDVTVRALGTEFNVKAYPEERNVETMLVKGSVEILKKNHVKPIVALSPGEKAIYLKTNSPELCATNTVKVQPQMIVQEDGRPDMSISWVRNQLVFNAIPFSQIAKQLERWYNVEIEIRNPQLKTALITGRYDTESIEQVLHSLQLTTLFSYTMNKNKIIIL